MLEIYRLVLWDGERNYDDIKKEKTDYLRDKEIEREFKWRYI